MNKILLILCFLPFLNFATLFIKKIDGEVDQVFAHFSSKIFAAIFVALLFKLSLNLGVFLEIFKINPHIYFGLKLDLQSLKQLFLIAIIWLSFVFYNQKLSQSKNSKDQEFIIFLPLFIGFLNVIILAKNLPTMISGYTGLALVFTIIFDKFLTIYEEKKSSFLTLLVFIEIFLLALATFFIAKFLPDLDFHKNGNQITATKFSTILALFGFLGGVFLVIFFPAFLLFHKNIDFSSPKNFLAFPLFFGFAKIVIFIKVIAGIFGIGLFSAIIGDFSLFFELFLAFSIITTLLLLLFSRNFYSGFFYLFFNQLSVAFLTIFALFYADQGNIYDIFVNFIFAITFSFIAFANLSIYFKNCENKDFDGIFPHLKVTISLLIFAFLNFASILPPISSQNWNLLEISIDNRLFVTFLVIIFNSIGLLLFIYKLVFPTFLSEKQEISEFDKRLSHEIDFSSHLSLTAFIVASTMIIHSIIF